MMAAWWEGFALGRCDFRAAFQASVDAGMKNYRTLLIGVIEDIGLIFGQKSAVFVGSHDCVLSIGWLST
jgi:hypothetical protein